MYDWLGSEHQLTNFEMYEAQSAEHVWKQYAEQTNLCGTKGV